MNTKSRLAKLEQIHAATAKQKAIKLISTPATRLQAATELDAWRATMSDDADLLATMREHDAHWVEHGHHRRPV